jgi:hypothetical protein
MLTESAANHASERSPDALDVVVLVVPENASPARLVDVVARAATRDHTALLVVLPHPTDSQTLSRITAAGANHCAIAPSPTELFDLMQRARADVRQRRRDDCADDDPLDVLWRSRSTWR